MRPRPQIIGLLCITFRWSSNIGCKNVVNNTMKNSRPGRSATERLKLQTSNFVHGLATRSTNLKVGLPTVPYFPGRPVFWPHCPASRPRPYRNAKCPVFRPWTNCIEIVQQMYAGS